jgi:uncharacterized coiled-coil DUF342 family protein
VLLGLLPLLFGASLCSVRGANLLRNADFEAHDLFFNLDHWVLVESAGAPAASPAIRPSPAGEVVLRLDADPSGLNWAAPQVMATQLDIDLPALPPPVRVVLAAQVARDPNEPGLANAIGFVLVVNTENGPQPAPFELDSDAVPADGNFHRVTGRLTLPPAPPNDLQFQLLKSGPGVFWVDGLSLEAESQDFQINPNRGPAAGGIPVQLNGPQLGPGANVFFGDAPANVLNAGPGFLLVLLPPNPPGAADVVVLNGTLTVREGAGFRYLEPLTVDSFMPRASRPQGGIEIHFTGSGFLPGLQIEFDLQPSTASFTVLSPGELVLIAPALSLGPHQITLRDPYGRTANTTQPLMVAAPPQVASVTPGNGPAQGGTRVTVRGNNFQPGAQVLIGYQDATDIEVISPTEIQATTTRNPPGLFDVSVTNPDGLTGALPESFEFTDKLPGDINGDRVLDLTDVVLAMQISAAQAPDVALMLDSDVNGDGKIGLEEGLFAFEGSERYDFDDFGTLPQPTLNIPNPQVTPGTPVVANVGNLAYFDPGKIDWGDGFFTELNASGAYAHLYDDSGNYQVKLLSGAGTTPPIAVSVHPEQSLRVTATALSLAGIDSNGQPITGRVAQIDPALPPLVTVQVTATGTGTFTGTLNIDAPSASNDTALAATFLFDDAAPGPHTRTAEFANLTFPEPGEYFITLTVDPGANVDPGATHPLPLTVQIPNYVTEEDCREIERQWNELKARKAAKRNDCAELAKKLAELEEKKDAIMAERDAAQAKRHQLQSDLDAKEDEFNDLFDYINGFLGGAGMLVQYMSAADFPPGNHVGARRNGASAGVGIAFDSAEAVINRFDLYKKANGHSLGQDLKKLRDCISKMDDLKNQIAMKDAEIAKLNADIDALCDQIDDLLQQLNDCKAECDALEAQIAALADAHRRCLEQLEKQREAEGAIQDAEQAGDKAQDEADRTGSAADDADDVIDGRAGTPGQTQADKDEVATGRACKDVAQDLINQGRQKLEEARQALRNGDTELAKQKAAEAKALFAQADQKLDDAREHIDDGRSSAEQRKRRECNDGEVQVGSEYEWKVWTEILDVSLAPYGNTPERWASSLRNAQAALDGLKKFLKLIDLVGDHSPIAGPVTPNADEAAQAIVDAHLELFKRRFPFDVWVRVRGYTAWNRTDRRCVNGCWVYEQVGGSRGDVCEGQINIGTIWGGTPAEREKQLKDILKNFGNRIQSQRK